MIRAKIYINKILHLFGLIRVKTDKKQVYLTFDDGPEGDITDFVLNELEKYKAKATFFCKGENVVKNPEQYQKILSRGHSVGNHTYSHLNSFKVSTREYLNDVNKAAAVIDSKYFRPPHGSLTFKCFLHLFRKYKIIHWSLISGDTELGSLDLKTTLERLKKKTKAGDIVLFHSCNLHSKETKLILPRYLEWLYSNGYKSVQL